VAVIFYGFYDAERYHGIFCFWPKFDVLSIDKAIINVDSLDEGRFSLSLFGTTEKVRKQSLRTLLPNIRVKVAIENYM